MAFRSRPVAVVACLFLLLPGAAIAGEIGVGSGAPPNKVIRFAASESSGAVTFRLLIWSGSVLPTSREVGSFTFADPCAATGSTKVKVRINVGSNLLFNYRAHGVRVSGGLNKKLTQAGGSVRVIQSGCDTGSPHFTATQSH
ncbi:MAG: hypothetical protein ACLP4R_16610 [Solirubrobacteraceae bacterium]